MERTGEDDADEIALKHHQSHVRRRERRLDARAITSKSSREEISYESEEKSTLSSTPLAVRERKERNELREQ